MMMTAAFLLLFDGWAALWLFTAMVASVAGHGIYRNIIFKVFLVDPLGHAHHVPRNLFVFLFITGEIESLWIVFLRSVAVITFNTQRGIESFHHFIQLLMADILR